MSPLSSILTMLALCYVVAFTGCVAAGTNGPHSELSFKRIDSGSYASLNAGKVKAIGDPGQREEFGVAAEIELTKLNSGPYDYIDAITGKTGEGEITYVSVPETLYSFILRNGAVQPLILDEEDWHVWYISGLGKSFSRCRCIGSGPKRMSFWGEGSSDIWPIWGFDFTDRVKGPIMRFQVDGGS